MEDPYYDIERRTAIKEGARLFRRKFLTYEQAEVIYSIAVIGILFLTAILEETIDGLRQKISGI